jgi:regulation of enolase protein 1 (concanavalin A-like superfamily)
VGTNVIATVTSAPYVYQWVNPAAGLYVAVNNTALSARVTDAIGFQGTSANVAITVDSSKPVAYAAGSLNGNGIGIYFNDASGLAAITATNPANYTVNDGAVSVVSAFLEPDNHAVLLTLNQQIIGNFKVEVKNLADRGFGPSVIDTTTLQSSVVNWFANRDIGTTNSSGVFTDPLMPGTAQGIGTSGLYMRAGGSDIWNNADGIHFAYVPIDGDFDVSVKVAGLSRPDNWTKAGIMVRQDLSGGSRNYNLVTTATNGQNQVVAQWRYNTNNASANLAKAGGTFLPDCWLRVTRTGQVFTSWFSTNGVHWTSFQSTNFSAIAYPNRLQVGLAMTSHNNGGSVANQASAYFYNLNGFTSAEVVPPTMAAKVQDGKLVISWSPAGGVLEASDSLAPGATWIEVPAATSPYQVTFGMGPAFYRVKVPKN